MSLRSLLAASLSFGLVAGAATAQDHADQIAARQGQFKLFALHLGVLATMGTGRAPYDAEAAQAAADNLVALSGLDQRALWPAGSDAGNVAGTRARPEIWENAEDFAAKLVALNAAAADMAGVAGSGQDAIGGQLRALSGTCAACHQAYRTSN